MKCVECRRTVSPDDTRCPYCGCTVLTVERPGGTSLTERARGVWNNDVPDNVVFLPRRRVAWVSWCLEAAILAAAWAAVLATLDMLSSGLAWIGFAVVFGVEFACLNLLGLRPWHTYLARNEPQVEEERGEDQRSSA